MDRPERLGAVDAVLAHFGVKGMKWGVRRPEGSRGPSPVKVRAFAGNRLVVTTGGRRNKLSEDATNAAVSRAKAKRSNVRSLSNRELQELVNRMNLEQQYRQLDAKRLDRGRETAQNLFNTGKGTYELGKAVVGAGKAAAAIVKTARS